MNYKIKILNLLFLTFVSYLNGQESSIKRSWTSYSQSIDITEEMRNSDFQVSVFIRKDSVGKSSKGALWTRVENGDFFQNDAYNEKVLITKQWKEYQIAGHIDSLATKLYIGGFVDNNGTYYFDEFSIKIKTKNGIWKTIPINNNGFEKTSDKDSWQEGIRVDKIVHVKNFNIEYSRENPYKGNFSLKIKGSNIIGSNQNGKYVYVNNVKLYYEIYGEGEPLLMIHGNGQSLGAFINQVEEFSKYYKVILVDCRGRGNSTYDSKTELTYALEASDMKLFLDYLKIDKANIIGWSDGGIIGLIMAIKYPEKVGKLVSMAANIFPNGIKKEQYDKIKKGLLSIKEGNEIRKKLYQLLLNYPNLEFKDLNVIKSKTLIIAGDQDVIKNSHTVKIFENISNSQLAILPNETHYLPEENFKLFNNLVLKFLTNEK